jgi:hypothetical protein
MDYSKLTATIAPQVEKAVALINNPEISPDVRQLTQEALLREVGQAVYAKIYDMNAWDMEIPHTTGAGVDAQRYYGMAKVASDSVSTGKLGLAQYLNNYIASTISQAQGDALKNARQSGKKPTVTRTEHANACAWCRGLAGTYTNPPAEVFMRHGGCEGKIVTEGYNSRNGTLDNYKKNPDAKAGPTPAIDRKGGQVVYRGTGNNTSGQGNMFGNALYVARDKTTASQFGTVSQLSLPLKSKDILQVTTDTQLDKLQLDAQKWAVKTGGSLDSQSYLPAYVRYKGYKAVEVAPTVDPFAGIAVVDPATIRKMQK